MPRFGPRSKMAHLKHGSQHAMSQQVIKGAMRALSRWMANTRKVRHGMR